MRKSLVIYEIKQNEKHQYIINYKYGKEDEHPC